MQKIGDKGLEPASAEERRCKIVPILNANSMLVQSLEAIWSAKKPEEAYDILSKDDVTVTNLKDKEQQLKKLQSLPKEVEQQLKKLRTMPDEARQHSEGNTHTSAPIMKVHRMPAPNDCFVGPRIRARPAEERIDQAAHGNRGSGRAGDH